MSYLSYGASSMRIDKLLSIPFDITSRVPESPILGPLLFIIYIIHISSILSKYAHIKYHLYADYLQLYISYYHSTSLIIILNLLYQTVYQIFGSGFLITFF